MRPIELAGAEVKNHGPGISGRSILAIRARPLISIKVTMPFCTINYRGFPAADGMSIWDRECIKKP